MLSLGNLVFQGHAIAAAIAVLYIAAPGWATVAIMMTRGRRLASPEDLRPGALNPSLSPAQLDPHDTVDRSRRMHRNEPENIPASLAVGVRFVLVDPPPAVAQTLFYDLAAAWLQHA